MKKSLKTIGNFFKNLFNFKKDGKLNIIKILIFVIILIIVVLGIIFGLNKSLGLENELNNKLYDLGVDFYENYYYNQIGATKEEKEAILSKFNTIGIKVSLDNLIRIQKDNSEDLTSFFVNNKTGEACDLNNTKVIIYPKEPYEQKDYDISTVLECGFSTKETTTKKTNDNPTSSTTVTTTSTTTTEKATTKTKKK